MSNDSINTNETGNMNSTGPTESSSFIGINVPLLSNETFRQIKEKRFSMIKPWSDFFDRNRVSLPKSFSDVTNKISHNIVYFQANYLIIVIVLLIYIMITNLLLLFSVVLIGAGFYYISRLAENEPVSFLDGAIITTRKQLYVVLCVVGVILLYLSSGGSALFWIVGVSSCIILVHASLLEASIESEFASTV